LYNSANIAEIDGRRFDLVINAGVSSLKWRANQHPTEDRRGIERLWTHLQTVEAERFIHISTMDVMPSALRWDEDTPAPPDDCLTPYGRHRRVLERWVRACFPTHLIVRLPHLFGPGMKKNFVFDLLYSPSGLQWVDERDVFCFYDLENLWADLTIFQQRELRVVNLSVEPVPATDIARLAFDVELTHRCDRAPVVYDMRTKWRYRHSAVDGYMYTRDETLAALRTFRSRV
jgi:nucleoside-diphosphate-sugar epimerase